MGKREKKHWYSYILALYMILLPVNTGFTGFFGDVSVSNYLALIFLCLGIIYLFQNGKFIIPNLGIFVLLYFLYTLLSLLWSNGSAGAWFIATYIMNAGIVIIGASLSYNEKEIKLIENAILIGIFFALYATYISLGSIPVYGRLMISFSRSIDPNQFSCDLFPIIALAFCRFFKSNNKKPMYFIIFIMSIIIVMMTGSRGAILGIIGMGITYLLLNRNNMGKRLFYLLLIGLVLSFVLFEVVDVLPKDLIDRFSIGSVLSSNASGRLRIWSNAFSTFKSSDIIHSLFGYGYGSFRETTRISNAYGSYYYAHNMFIQTLIEGGVIGVILLFIMLINLFKMAKRGSSEFAVILLVGVIIASLDLDIQASRLFSVATIIPFVYWEAKERFDTN